jgi:hypothetical protein
LLLCKAVKSARGIAPRILSSHNPLLSWLAQPECDSDDWRHAADTSRTRGGSSAHREGEGCRRADPSIKWVDELLVWAAVTCRAGEPGGVPTVLYARAMGKNISRPKQVTDWVARLEKLEQALAAESGSGLLVQPAWIEKNVPDFCATNSLVYKVRKIPACLCQVHRLLYSRQTEAGVARTLISRLKAAEFLVLRGGC